MALSIKKGNALIRLKPYDPSRGCVKETFRMGAACGWHDIEFTQGQLMEINADAAHWLADNIRQRDEDPSSPKAFQVWDTAKECAEFLRKERLQKLHRANPIRETLAPNKPPKLTTAEVSRLDEPPATSALEAELLAMQAATANAPEEPEEEDLSDFSAFAADINPVDDMAKAAKADDDAPRNRPPAKPKTRRTRKAPKRGK